MANTKMLIDATHPEETRVVVQRNGRVEEFDFESAARKLLRGNIYLAKVTRVEPSLQAAFVDYGGNRHGFLAFNEIHPDYYQIPVADRQALIEEEAAAEAELEAAADRRAEALARRSGGRRHDAEAAPTAGSDDDNEEPDNASGDGETPSLSHIVDVEEDEHIEEVGGEGGDDAARVLPAAVDQAADTISEPATHYDAPHHDAMSDERAPPDHEHGASTHHHHEAEDDEGDDGDHDGDTHALQPGDIGQNADATREISGERAPGDDHDEAEAPSRPRRRPRSYKIQEVIKRRQVILVQVVKEERGNKGAALTTYLSLAGRYTVLMPNTARGGGISRKITNPQDRKRLKAIAQELEVPEGMGLIIRTAGAARTKQEIKRDFEYLLRLWESVRDLTLQSTAPALVYEEGDLIKRSIRDLYNKDVEEIVVAGDAGYKDAAGFMHMLMPSHIKNVVDYKDPTPLFTKYGVERQLNAMFLPQVTLRSGGYIVINQTEALVAIDVNSGKSTREFSIEETALATNLEASDEIARQLKLRDLAGLIVIDFIDMEEKRNNRAVERRLKDALRFDRARIQLGRISHFGLMEMSRQRLRTGVLEGSTTQCPHCQGTGVIRSTESIALAVLRGLEDTITAGAQTSLIATCATTVALYILNSKRAYVTDMEARHGFPVTVVGSDRVHGANFTVERGAATLMPVRRPERAAVNMNWGFEGEGDVEDEAPSFEGAEIETVGDPDDLEAGARESRGGEAHRERGEGEEDGGRRGKRGRRRGRGRGQRGERGEPRGEFRSDRAPTLSVTAAGGGAAIDEDAENDAVAGGESNGDEQNAHGGQPGPAGETREEAAGRRRRRGRRGGRRGRDRDRPNGPREFSADADGSGSDPSVGEAPNKPEPQGLGPQPQFVKPAQRFDSGPASAEQPNAPQSERRRPDRIWDVPSAASSSHAPAPVATHAPEPKAAPAVHDAAPADTSSSRRRHETGSSEPRIERVVVTPDQTGDTPVDAAPQRKGWWQRRFGGE